MSEALNHWIIVPVVLPAMLAPFIVLALRHDLLLQRVASMVGTLALGLIGVGLVMQASAQGPQAYYLGNWPAPFGIVLVLDRLSAMLVALTALVALVVQIHVITTGWDARGRHFHALFQFQLMGICGAFLTGDAFNMFVFFEILLIASYGLMIHAGGRERLRAGVQYVAYNLAGSTLFLFALGTLYAVTGTLNIADLGVKLSTLPEGDLALARVAGVLLMIVFAVKGALVPFQFWLPATYAMAPGPVAALFAIMTKVGAYAILRFYTVMFPDAAPVADGFFSGLLLPAALVTMALGMLGILGARSLGRMAAYAAIGSMGTLFIALAPFSAPTTAAALYYLIHSTLAAMVLFLVCDLTLEGRGTDSLTVARPPLAHGHGLVTALFFAAAIATAGMPPLSGFIGKLLILDALREGANAMWLWAAILAASLVAILGLGRAGSQVFWKAYATEGTAPATAAPAPLAYAATMIGVALIAGLTVASGPVTAWLAETAAEIHDTSAYMGAVLGR